MLIGGRGRGRTSYSTWVNTVFGVPNLRTFLGAQHFKEQVLSILLKLRFLTCFIRGTKKLRHPKLLVSFVNVSWSGADPILIHFKLTPPLPQLVFSAKEKRALFLEVSLCCVISSLLNAYTSCFPIKIGDERNPYSFFSCSSMIIQWYPGAA